MHTRKAAYSHATEGARPQAAPASKSSPDGPMGTASGCACVHLAWADGSVEHSLCCMRSEELRTAAAAGDTKTVVAFLARGADVRCKTNGGYGFSRLHPRVGWVSDSVGADGPSTRGEAAGVPVLAVQGDGAALCVVERPHGDGAGAGQGGRGRARQGQQRVRFSWLHRCVGWVLTLRGVRSVRLGWS
jgi:hypothetical protein